MLLPVKRFDQLHNGSVISFVTLSPSAVNVGVQNASVAVSAEERAQGMASFMNATVEA
jgi:hypothetical protein